MALTEPPRPTEVVKAKSSALSEDETVTVHRSSLSIRMTVFIFSCFDKGCFVIETSIFMFI